MSGDSQLETIKVFLPKLGESITQATVIKWLKKKGDPVSLDEPLLEVATDKVNSEIPSPVSGFLEEIYAIDDQEKEVGELLCLISKKMKEKSQVLSEKKEEITQSSAFLSPAVVRLMKEYDINQADISKIPTTGMNGRLTKCDVENFIHGRVKPVEIKQSCPIALDKIELSFEKMKMSKIRKAIAENMAKSFYSAPHATLVQEIDLTNASKWIKKEKDRVLKEKNIKLTITAFIAYAISRAVEQFPLINSTLDHDDIIIKKHVNLGLAVSVDQAVMVPVIKNSQSLSVLDIAKEIQTLALKAKMQNLDPQDVKEGTLTITNFGMMGTMIGIPIIRFPEVAIIGVGAMAKKVVVLENDAFGIREMAHLSLTFDHRVLDGMYGCGFLAEIKKILEKTSWDEICTL